MSALKIIVWVGFLIASFSLPVFAEVAAEGHDVESETQGESSHNEGHDAHAINWIDLSNDENPPLVPMFFNFIVTIFLVYLLLRKGLGAKIRNRKTDLESALAEANGLKKEAEEAMAIAKERSEAFDLEMAQIRTDVLAAANAQAALIEKEAVARAEQMASESTAFIAQEIALMSQEIRKEVVEQVVTIAEKRIVEKITKTDLDNIDQEFLESVMSTVQDSKMRS